MTVKSPTAAVVGLALLLSAVSLAAYARTSVTVGPKAKVTAKAKADPKAKPAAQPIAPPKPDEVRCALLTYGKGKTSVCFSDKFLAQARKDTHIRAYPRFERVKAESPKLCDYPFAVMTGEGKFKLTDAQRRNLRQYLVRGGFIVASAGCSSKPWNKSFAAEMKKMFPDEVLGQLGADHPVFHTVYDITSSRYKASKAKLPKLKGLELDGKIALIWSRDGLNDTSNAGPNCCCCGGDEVKSAKKVNVNLLAYALTH